MTPVDQAIGDSGINMNLVHWVPIRGNMRQVAKNVVGVHHIKETIATTNVKKYSYR